MIVVISQPMLFPWIGLLEQVRLADTYVHYADVQFSKGSFVNRVQVKTANGVQWMSVPLHGLRLGQRIDEVRIDDRKDWRKAHLDLLRAAYDAAPYRDSMLDLVQEVHAGAYDDIGGLSEASLTALCRYFGLDRGRRFVHSDELGIEGASSRRVLDIVTALQGTTYVTGHGASRYLDHDLFEQAGVRVEYMHYQKAPYPQLHGAFTPFVSTLDLIANRGPDGVHCIRSGSIYWKEFLSDGPDRTLSV